MEVKLALENNGFTLLETLLVISLITTLMLILVQPITEMEKKIKINNDKQIVLLTLEQARECSLYQEATIKLMDKQLVLFCPKREIKRNLVSEITSNYEGGIIKFNHKAKVNRAGTIKLNYHQLSESIIINIGFGYES